MRIVHVVQCLGMGGQERLILNLSRVLAARGHEPSVISLTEGGELRSEFDGIHVVDVTRKDGKDPLLALRLFRALARLAPHAVHTHNPSPMFYALPAARALGVRRVVHTKHGVNIYGSKGLIAARLYVRALSALVVVSEGTADVARKKERVPERLLHVIPNGIPLGRFNPDAQARARIRKELAIPDDAFVVGTVGRLWPEKDHALFLRAMKPLLGEKTRVVIIGEGPSRGDLEKLIAEMGVGKYVTLTGVRRDVPQALAAFDVFTLTSRTEGLPLVIPEAMACALPIVATAVGGLPSIVPEHVGVLAKYGDEEALRRAFESFANDRAKREKTGAAARAHALASFSIEKMADAYEALYRGSPRGRA